uniref:small monomeric GTPase n=1 Tax=Saccoglossus kowalevskii TaxID=10224 RepID=A0ABM0M955_SACKO|nr:PREDICTED: ras-related and estrogen-regulated growth inhibitor-like [Saccoglossus kowalevskii]
MTGIEAKVVVLGCPNVGKSALTVRFLTGRFIGEYESNLDRYYKHLVPHNDVSMSIEVLDSCCQEQELGEELLCKESHVKWGDAFVVVYNICDRRTFDVLERQIQYIHKAKVPCSVPIAIIGNKTDLNAHRQVPLEDGELLAEEYGCHFFEVTARGGCTGVSKAFTSIVQDVNTTKRQKTTLRRRNSVTKAISNKVLSAVQTFRTKQPHHQQSNSLRSRHHHQHHHPGETSYVKPKSRKTSLQMF